MPSVSASPAPCPQGGGQLVAPVKAELVLGGLRETHGRGLQSPARDQHLTASHMCNLETSLSVPKRCSVPCHCHHVPAGCSTPCGHPTGPAVPVGGGGNGGCQGHDVPGWGARPPLMPPPATPAPILPRPVRAAAVQVISSKSPSASSLISCWELGLARPAGRLLVEGTFAAALPPGARHITVLVPQTRHRAPCPKPPAAEAGEQNQCGWAGGAAGAPGSELERVRHRWDC